MRTTILLLTLAVSYFSFAGTKVLPYKQDVNIDGRNDEWPSPLSSYNKKTRINFEVANDERNLFFVLQVTDTTIQKQIMQNGLEVWINYAGKKKKTTGVKFPIPPKTLDEKGLPIVQDQQVPGWQPGAPLKQRELILTGFLVDNGQQPINGCPVHTALSIDESGSLIYELAVPFNTFYKEYLDAGDAKTNIYIGFIINASIPSEAAAMQMMMRGMGYSEGMRRVGGMGGMGITDATSETKTAIERNYWFKVLPSIR